MRTYLVLESGVPPIPSLLRNLLYGASTTLLPRPPTPALPHSRSSGRLRPHVLIKPCPSYTPAVTYLLSGSHGLPAFLHIRPPPPLYRKLSRRIHTIIVRFCTLVLVLIVSHRPAPARRGARPPILSFFLSPARTLPPLYHRIPDSRPIDRRCSHPPCTM